MTDNEIRITVIDGGSAGEVLSSPISDTVWIGRSRSCEIRLDRDPEISGRHFKIEREGDVSVMTNEGKNTTCINGRKLENGEKCRLAAGDEIRVCEKIRFRFDSIGVTSVTPASDSPSMTAATMATRATMSAAATMATRATTSAAATMATRATTSAVTSSVGMFVPGRRSTVIESQPTIAVGTESVDENSETCAMDCADSPTGQLSAEAATGDFGKDGASVDSSSFGDSSTNRNGGEVTGRDDPKTTAISGTVNTNSRTRANATQGDSGTGFVDPALYKRMREIERRKRLYRRILMGVSALIFLSVMGCVVWLRWPRAERYLTIPLKPGTEERDYAHVTLKDEAGRNALVAYYVRDRSMREKRIGDGGIEVSSVLGRDRDVDFWLRVTRMNDENELQLSLEQSVARLLKARYAKDRLTPLSTPEWSGNGYCFMEEEYPGASHGFKQGTRMFRSEYQVVRNRSQRHGVLFVLRNRSTVWLIEHDIPEAEWERGKYQMKINPNFEFFAGYLENRWESPGMGALSLDRDVADLFREVEYALELPTPRKGEWPQLKRKLDTLVYRTVKADNADTARALKLLNRFRNVQDREYNGYVLSFANFGSGGTKGKSGRLDVSESCRKVFGVDDEEYFSALIGDLEAWQCQKRNH